MAAPNDHSPEELEAELAIALLPPILYLLLAVEDPEREHSHLPTGELAGLLTEHLQDVQQGQLALRGVMSARALWQSTGEVEAGRFDSVLLRLRAAQATLLEGPDPNNVQLTQRPEHIAVIPISSRSLERINAFNAMARTVGRAFERGQNAEELIPERVPVRPQGREGRETSVGTIMRAILLLPLLLPELFHMTMRTRAEQQHDLVHSSTSLVLRNLDDAEVNEVLRTLRERVGVLTRVWRRSVLVRTDEMPVDGFGDITLE